MTEDSIKKKQELTNRPDLGLTPEQNEEYSSLYLHWSQEQRIAYVMTELDELNNKDLTDSQDIIRRRKLSMEKERLLNLKDILASKRRRLIAENLQAETEAMLKVQELRNSLKSSGKLKGRSDG